MGQCVFKVYRGLPLVYIHSVKVVVVLVISYLLLFGIHITLIAKSKQVLTSLLSRDLFTFDNFISRRRLIHNKSIFIQVHYVLVIEPSLEVLDTPHRLLNCKLFVNLAYWDLCGSGCDGISFLNSIAFDFAWTRINSL